MVCISGQMEESMKGSLKEAKCTDWALYHCLMESSSSVNSIKARKKGMEISNGLMGSHFKANGLMEYSKLVILSYQQQMVNDRGL